MTIMASETGDRAKRTARARDQDCFGKRPTLNAERPTPNLLGPRLCSAFDVRRSMFAAAMTGAYGVRYSGSCRIICGFSLTEPENL
jgi:hypothetical protein